MTQGRNGWGVVRSQQNHRSSCRIRRPGGKSRPQRSVLPLGLAVALVVCLGCVEGVGRSAMARSPRDLGTGPTPTTPWPAELPPRSPYTELWGPLGLTGLSLVLWLSDRLLRHRLLKVLDPSLMAADSLGAVPGSLGRWRWPRVRSPQFPRSLRLPRFLAHANPEALGDGVVQGGNRSMGPMGGAASAESCPSTVAEAAASSLAEAQSPAYADLWNRVVAVTSAAADFDSALEEALQVLGQETGWVAGEAWVPSLDGASLVCSPAWFCAIEGVNLFRQASLDLTLKLGCQPPGRVWQTKRPEWISNYELESIDHCSRSQMALGVGLRSSVVLPILTGDHVLAVLTLFATSPRERDLTLLNRLAIVTAQLGPILQHKQAEARYRNLFERAIEGIFQVSPDGRYLHANPAFAAILGYESPEAALRALNATDRRLYVRPADEVRFLELLEQSQDACNFECQVYCQDGQRIWVDQRAQAVRDRNGRLLYYEGCLLDITSRKWVEAQLQYNSSHDVLTGLWNRSWFLERLVEAVSRGRRDPQFRFVLLFLDIDGFKRINNSLGYWVGDRLLMMLAGRLEKAISPDYVLARTGGDEFVVLVESAATSDEGQLAAAKAAAHRLQDVFRDPFVVDGRDVFLQASMGIVCRPDSHGDSRPDQPYRILRDADAALHRAKQQRNGSFVIFDAALQSDTEQLLQLETDLRWAIERREFCLHYQPIVSLDSRSIVGFESLIRWQHPRHGLMMPASFIGLAEDRGAIVPIGNWVLQSACKQIAIWKTQMPEVFPIWVNVNLSARQLVPELADLIEVLMDAYDLEGYELRLEITETSLALDPNASRACLDRLRERRIKICLDDFGTGYCSLNYLREFPIDSIKIERSFIQAMLENQRDAAIVRAVIGLANDLGLSVIAEGIETQPQIDHLRDLGCGFGQGYLFSRAVPAEEAGLFLNAGLPPAIRSLPRSQSARHPLC
ncbi:MAG: EAL domain-containing protein [Limnothrix sp. BL-A-16]